MSLKKNVFDETPAIKQMPIERYFKERNLDTSNEFLNNIIEKDKFLGGMGGIKTNITDDEIVFTISVPGFKKDEIKISIRDSFLIVEGTRLKRNDNPKKGIKESKKEEILRMASIPDSFVSDSMKQNYSNEILTITFNKK